MPVPLDPELAEFVRARPELTATITRSNLAKARAYQLDPRYRISAERLASGGAIQVDDLSIALPGGDRRAVLLRPRDGTAVQAGVLYVHGGGYTMGDERTGLEAVLGWVTELGLAVLSVDYRLAPEHPFPAAFDDCYATLCWFAEHASRYGVDPGPLIVAGSSAGGGIAAALALKARSEAGPRLSLQLLMSPMLDDRADTPSSLATEHDSVWDRPSNQAGWAAYLREHRGADQYAAPAHAEDLRDLPPAFVDVGSAEGFRDEATRYAARLADAGVATELHIWWGGFHGFDVIACDTVIARAARAARLDFLRRQLTPAAGREE
jgi:acetyl esterase/lipase